jgi:hypothetical protein
MTPPKFSSNFAAEIAIPDVHRKADRCREIPGKSGSAGYSILADKKINEVD